MKKRKVISSNNLPIRAPVLATFVWWLVLEKLGVPSWAFGVIGTLIAVAWVVFFIDLFNREEINVLNGKDSV